MMLGREINMPADLMFGQGTTSVELDSNSYVRQLQDTLKNVHELDRAQLKTSQQRAKRDYDVHINERAYKKGDVVYILDTASKKGKCRKLSPSWKGPGAITEKLTPYLYRVKCRSRESVMHHDRLQLCRDRETPVWLQKYLQQQEIEESVRNDKETQTTNGDLPPFQACPPKQTGIDKGSNTDSVLALEPVYCICKKSWEEMNGSFMVGCDECDGWFHGDCVGVTKEQAESMAEYLCPKCSGGAPGSSPRAVKK